MRGKHTLARISGGHIQLCATALREYWVLSIQVQVVDGLVHLPTSTAHPSGADQFCWQTRGLYWELTRLAAHPSNTSVALLTTKTTTRKDCCKVRSLL